MIREPKTDPIPAPDPATPTVAAPAPMNLAAESMSLEVVVVWKLRVRGATAMGRATTWLLTATVLAAGRASLAAYMVAVVCVDLMIDRPSSQWWRTVNQYL